MRVDSILPRKRITRLSQQESFITISLSIDRFDAQSMSFSTFYAHAVVRTFVQRFFLQLNVFLSLFQTEIFCE